MLAFNFNGDYASRVRDAILRGKEFPPPASWDELLAVAAVCQFIAFQIGDPDRMDPVVVFLVNKEQGEAILADRMKCIRGIVAFELKTITDAMGPVASVWRPLPTFSGQAFPEREMTLTIADVVPDEGLSIADAAPPQN
jgi:hypothetical protein